MVDLFFMNVGLGWDGIPLGGRHNLLCWSNNVLYPFDDARQPPPSILRCSILPQEVFYFNFSILNGVLVDSLFYFCSTQQVGENTTSGTLRSKKNYDETNIKIIVTTYSIFSEN